MLAFCSVSGSNSPSTASFMTTESPRIQDSTEKINDGQALIVGRTIDGKKRLWATKRCWCIWTCERNRCRIEEMNDKHLRHLIDW